MLLHVGPSPLGADWHQCGWCWSCLRTRTPSCEPCAGIFVRPASPVFLCACMHADSKSNGLPRSGGRPGGVLASPLSRRIPPKYLADRTPQRCCTCSQAPQTRAERDQPPWAPPHSHLPSHRLAVPCLQPCRHCRPGVSKRYSASHPPARPSSSPTPMLRPTAPASASPRLGPPHTPPARAPLSASPAPAMRRLCTNFTAPSSPAPFPLPSSSARR